MTEPLNLQTNVVIQHTVPRFLLRNFSSTGREKHRRLHAFDKATGLSYATTGFKPKCNQNQFINFDENNN